MKTGKHFAMIGTRGVPALYGGFETAVEEIGSRLVDRGHQVTVYCRNEGQVMTQHRGIELVNLPALRKRSLETLSHSGLSVLHALRRKPDAAVLFNAANSPYLPLLRARGIPTALHMDGLEWKRAKWAGAGARYYRWAEARAARSARALIADAHGIADYVKDTYARDSYMIPYGAPILSPGTSRLQELGVSAGGYHLVVARLEPENHVREIVAGYAASDSSLPLLVVGGAPYGESYIDATRAAAGSADVRFVGPVWDQDLLNELYAHCRSYLHGHSVGGTNPSLLRAMGCGAPVSAFDVNFNQEVTGRLARFFTTPADVAQAIRLDDQSMEDCRRRGEALRNHAAAQYRWSDVAHAYESMLMDLVRGS